MSGRHVVTGAFSFTGRYIAEALLEKGVTVATLTRQPDPNHSLFARLESLPLQFEDADRLARDLSGADVLYNTYWVRFNHGGVSFDQAITNTGRLLAAAKRAGIRRLVHLSVSNPSETSDLAYYRGKAVVERMVSESGLSYAISPRPGMCGNSFSASLLVRPPSYRFRRSPVLRWTPCL